MTGEGGYLVGKFYSGAYGTVGGVKIDENCQVLDDEDQVIPGLYSAGSDANTIYADSYNVTLPGNTMGFAVNSGRIAGLEAAKFIEKQLHRVKRRLTCVSRLFILTIESAFFGSKDWLNMLKFHIAERAS